MLPGAPCPNCCCCCGGGGWASQHRYLSFALPLLDDLQVCHSFLAAAGHTELEEGLADSFVVGAGLADSHTEVVEGDTAAAVDIVAAEGSHCYHSRRHIAAAEVLAGCGSLGRGRTT